MDNGITPGNHFYHSGTGVLNIQTASTHNVPMLTAMLCDARPTVPGYLPSRTASPLINRYQIKLLGDRSTMV